MLKTYPAIFHKEEEGYWVEFPEFGGGTQGEDLEEAMKNARQMLESVLASYLDEGMKLPNPSEIRKLSVEDGFATMIQADPNRPSDWSWPAENPPVPSRFQYDNAPAESARGRARRTLPCRSR